MDVNRKLEAHPDYSHLAPVDSIAEFHESSEPCVFAAYAQLAPIALKNVDYSRNISSYISDVKLPRWRPESWWNVPIKPPSLSIARLNGPVHIGGAVLLDCNMAVIPASFPRYSRASYDDDIISRRKEGGWALTRNVDTSSSLKGTYYFIGDLPDQYGHFLLEVMPRLWAYRYFRSLPLLGFGKDSALLNWQEQLLRLADIDPNHLTILTEPSRIESLVVVDPSYRLHTTASPIARDIYRQMAVSSDCDGLGDRIFLTRRSWGRRRILQNESDVERLFEMHGFRIVAPEQLSVDEQVAIARDARCLAGAIGSGMYNAAFQRPGCRNFVLAPQNFALRDDQLLAYVTGGEVAYFFSPNVDSQETSTRAANWSVDLDQLETALKRWEVDISGGAGLR